MSNLYCEIEFVNACLELIGMMGPVRVHCNMVEHNIFLEEEISAAEYKRLSDADTIIFGCPGVVTTKDDVKSFLRRLEDHCAEEAFDNGRTYGFEGTWPTAEGFALCWGS
jgi:hypothetical protein